MGLLVDRDQLPVVEVRVLLRRRQRDVAEQLLNGAQIGTGIQKVRGEGVPQRVRRYSGAERGAAHIAVEQTPNTAGRDPLATIVEKKRLPLVLVAASQFQSSGEPRSNGRLGFRSKRDDALLRSFAADLDQPASQLDIVEIDPYELADAKPGSIEKLHPGTIADTKRLSAVRLFKESLDVRRLDD